MRPGRHEEYKALAKESGVEALAFLRSLAIPQVVALYLTDPPKTVHQGRGAFGDMVKAIRERKRDGR